MELGALGGREVQSWEAFSTLSSCRCEMIVWPKHQISAVLEFWGLAWRTSCKILSTTLLTRRMFGLSTHFGRMVLQENLPQKCAVQHFGGQKGFY